MMMNMEIAVVLTLNNKASLVTGEAIARQESSFTVHRTRLRIGRLMNPASNASDAAPNPEAIASPPKNLLTFRRRLFTKPARSSTSP
jgi:hypothetical protein